MTKTLSTNFSPLFNQLNRVALGFDPIFHDIENRFNVATSNYPPYNVAQKGENTISLEIAVAGFKKEEIEVEFRQRKLTVSGKKIDVDEEDEILVKYTHKGISTRAFKLSWTVADHVEVSSAELVDGILIVDLAREVPEEEKPTLIDIK